MNLTELKQIVSAGESERLEFKRSTGQRTEAAKTACALLNGTGGIILFGVSDRGELSGQEVTARTLELIVSELRRVYRAFPTDKICAAPEDRSRFEFPATTACGSAFTNRSRFVGHHPGSFD